MGTDGLQVNDSSNDELDLDMPNSMRARHRRAALKAAAAAAATVVASGCAAVNWILNDGVGHPMSPEQAKVQVVEAARDIVTTLNLPVLDVVFWRSGCKDGGGSPFRARIRIAYPRAVDFAASDDEIAKMTHDLQKHGWTIDSTFSTHGTPLAKGGVVANFWPQSVSPPTRSLELLGECRDVTTTKETKGNTEHITLG